VQRGLDAALKVRTEQQLIARHNRPAKTGFVQPLKIEACGFVRKHTGGHERQDARGLRQRLDDNYAGHQRAGGEMPSKERLIVSHILQSTDALSRMNFKHSIDEQKGVAVREVPEDRADVEAERISHGRHPRGGAPGSRNEFDPAPDTLQYNAATLPFAVDTTMPIS
jgi:hypothetical protein